MINIGDMAPDLLGLDEAGNEIKLSQYRGRKTALRAVLPRPVVSATITKPFSKPAML